MPAVHVERCCTVFDVDREIIVYGSITPLIYNAAITTLIHLFTLFAHKRNMCECLRDDRHCSSIQQETVAQCHCFLLDGATISRAQTASSGARLLNYRVQFSGPMQ